MPARIDDTLMRSINFEFLRPKWPDLAGLGGFAEAYAHNDPIGAIGKLRAFCEQAAKVVHHELRLPRLLRPNLIDLLDDTTFQSAVPRVVVSKMHALRIEGNHAVHGNRGDTTTALRLLKEAYDLSRWLFVNFAAGRVEDCPQFTQPPEGGVEAVERRREKRAILERLTAQEAQMQKLLADLEAERDRAQLAVASAAELQLALVAGQQSAAAIEAVDPLSFNEQQTRRSLIDVMLVDAGWDVGPELTNTHEVKKEVKVAGQPTNSGVGFADYVLMDDGCWTARPTTNRCCRGTGPRPIPTASASSAAKNAASVRIARGPSAPSAALDNGFWKRTRPSSRSERCQPACSPPGRVYS
jgi:type I restriction enzyme, R subunit